jgi:hypothetical protein
MNITNKSIYFYFYRGVSSQSILIIFFHESSNTNWVLYLKYFLFLQCIRLLMNRIILFAIENELFIRAFDKFVKAVFDCINFLFIYFRHFYFWN